MSQQDDEQWSVTEFAEWLDVVFDSAHFEDKVMPDVIKHRVIDSQREKSGVMVIVVEMVDGSSFDLVLKEHGHPTVPR